MRHLSILPILLLSAGLPSLACGVCGCSTHTDWASQGLWSGPGFRLDLRYDYYKQDQLRRGSGRVDRAAFDFPAEGEVQVQTLNRNLTLGLDWSPNADWGFGLAVPTIHRTHETVMEGETEVSDSRHVGLGDVRVLGRYAGVLEDHSLGLQVGIKLPTGKRAETFRGTDEPVDRGLQAGTGTMDVLLGVFKFGDLSAHVGYFLQAQFQAATGSKDGFRPGNAFTFVSGIRLRDAKRFTPQLQVNLRSERPESGEQADALNSGSTLAYLSPGVAVTFSSKLSLSVFVQIPVYQRVTGLQLEPRSLASLSLHYAF